MVKFPASASVACILMVMLGANRGFDISDEGLYVLLTDPLQQNVAGIFNYDLFFKALHKISGYTFGIVELRIFRLLTYLVAALSLAGFWKNITREKDINREVFWISFLGLLAGYAFLPPTLSYNSLSVVLVCGWLNFISRERISPIAFFYLGIVLGLVVYVKVSLALFFFPLTLAVHIVRKRKVGVGVFAMVLPLIVIELSLLTILGESAWTRLAAGIPSTFQRRDYQPDLIIKSITVGGFWVSCVALLSFAYGYFRKVGSKLSVVFLIMAIVGMAAVSYLTHITDEWNHLVLIFTSSLFGYCFGLNRKMPVVSRLWTGLLLFLPFILHFGSNVYWLRIGIHYWVFWILAFLLCFGNLWRQIGPVVSFSVVLLVFNGIWVQPFGQDEPLWEEKHSWNRGSRETIQLDPELLAILDKMKTSRIGNTPELVLAAYRVPGLVWLVGTQMPFSPGIWDESQLSTFFKTKPKVMIFKNLDSLPQNWAFIHHQNLGVYQGDSLQLLWD